jgi:hypothetical protein
MINRFSEALRSGMAVQMVKTKPRGWVGDARRRHHRKHVTWNINVVRHPGCPLKTIFTTYLKPA